VNSPGRLGRCQGVGIAVHTIRLAVGKFPGFLYIFIEHYEESGQALTAKLEAAFWRVF